MKQEKIFVPNLGLCILMDAIGMATYAVPFLAEFADVIWAPLSALIFYKLFGGKFGQLGAGLNFLEEIIPYTDVIPTFTIAWFIRKKQADKLLP